MTSVTPAADNGSGTAITTSGTISVLGTANEVTTSVTGTTITVGLPDEVTVVDLNTDRVDFNTSPASTTAAVGRELWDSTWETLSLGMNANVSLKHGQQLYIRGHNSTGTQIDRGKVVYISGGHATTEALIALADADAENTSANTVGIAAEDIAHGSTGFVQVFGYMAGLVTNGYSGAEGTALYLSTTAGDMTSTLPTAPKHGFRVGLLIKKSGSGSIFVSPQNYQELEELSDVLVGTTGGGTALADNDLLQYDSASSVWRNTTIANAGVAAASHVHSGADITSGTVGFTYLPTGTGATQVAIGNHAHGNITTDGKVGSTSGLVVVTTTAGSVTTLADGSSGTFLTTNGAGTLSWGTPAGGSAPDFLIINAGIL